MRRRSLRQQAQGRVEFEVFEGQRDALHDVRRQAGFDLRRPRFPKLLGFDVRLLQQGAEATKPIGELGGWPSALPEAARRVPPPLRRCESAISSMP